MLCNQPGIENEAALVEQAKNDDSAFEILYNHYFPKIYGYIFKRTGHHETAQDLVSEIFIRVFCHLKEYQYQGHTFGAWVYRIATNHLIDYYRRSGSRKEVNIEAIQELPARQDNPQNFVQEKQNKEIVQKIINQLPKRYQKIINLRYFAEKSHEEIAVSLGISPANARVLTHRALKKFQKLYQKYGQ